MLVTIVASFATFERPATKFNLLFSPYLAQRGEWYRVITHAFIHADVMHLVFNMFVLYNFGYYVEDLFMLYHGDAKGEYFYAVLYVGGILFATLPGFAKHSENDSYFSLGASGAVAAVVFAFILMEPSRDLYLLFLPIPIPAFIFGIAYLALEFYLDKRGQGRVAHDAHFWGAIFGFVFTGMLDTSRFSEFFTNFIPT